MYTDQWTVLIFDIFRMYQNNFCDIMSPPPSSEALVQVNHLNELIRHWSTVFTVFIFVLYCYYLCRCVLSFLFSINEYEWMNEWMIEPSNYELWNSHDGTLNPQLYRQALGVAWKTQCRTLLLGCTWELTQNQSLSSNPADDENRTTKNLIRNFPHVVLT